MLIMYVIISVIIGAMDLMKLAAFEEEIASFPRGDVGEYVSEEPAEPILGIHNFLFPISFLVIFGWIGIMRLRNMFWWRA